MEVYNSVVTKNDHIKRYGRPKRCKPRAEQVFSNENGTSDYSTTSNLSVNNSYSTKSQLSIHSRTPHENEHLEANEMEITNIDDFDKNLPTAYVQGSVLDDELLSAKLQQVALEQNTLPERFKHLDSRSSLNSWNTNEDGEQNTFYVNANSPLVINSSSETSSVQDAPISPDVVRRGTFAGRRNILKSSSAFNGECEIRSPKGTVRGYKNRVAAGIATFHFAAEQVAGKAQEVDYTVVEDRKIILYSTNLTVNREVHRDCQVVRSILHTHMILYEERDLCMNKELQKELKSRLDGELILPAVFVDGRYLGSAEKLEILNESGELRKIFAHFPCVSVRSACERCGGYRYVPCTICHGSKKSLHRNHFTETFHALRCTICNENGLIQCVVCHNQPR